ncbi:MAG TPA: response regulator [Geminicoccus sp.]|uniref:response regulator n=1 Tax=Geminicoccus sp. TaxID=2024832 RepID=UPI002E33E9F4|nr:response regulator [Geminicoccus sp.]HEX2527892.1 response regulator [Geminicoccus sp.]
MASMAAEIAQILPYLRRYARAITGDQRLGDIQVQRCLERLLTDRSNSAGLPLRILLFRNLTRSWGDHGAQEPSTDAPIANVDILDRRMREIAPARRQALVLSVLEGFSVADIGTILDLSPQEAEELLALAKVDLRDQRPTRIMIIEDEPIIALDLANICERNGHEVVGIAATRTEAVAKAMEQRPGLILADIQLADDSSGIDAVSDILASMSVPVIFITAFPERLLTGQRPEPTFLITKPFDADTLAVSISQALATAAA